MKKTLLLAGSAVLLSQCSPSGSSISVDRYAELSGRPAKTPREYAITIEFKETKETPTTLAPYRKPATPPVLTLKARPGKEATAAVEQEFVYPAAYRPPGFSSLVMKTSQSEFPVTPATPKEFQKRNLGYQVKLKARPQGAFVVVQGSVSHEKFIGFTRMPGEAIAPIVDGSRQVIVTENRVEMPNFVRSETPIFIAGLPGVAQVVDLPGVPGSMTVTVQPLD
jgi:hypothetical protein